MKIFEKSIKICPTSVPEAFLEGSGGHLGPKSRQDRENPVRGSSADPPKSSKNHPKTIKYGCNFPNDFCKGFLLIFGWFLEAKMDPKTIQIESRMQATCRHNFWAHLARKLTQQALNATCPMARLIWPCQYKINVFNFWLFGCWIDVAIDVG